MVVVKRALDRQVRLFTGKREFDATNEQAPTQSYRPSNLNTQLQYQTTWEQGISNIVQPLIVRRVCIHVLCQRASENNQLPGLLVVFSALYPGHR